MHFHTHATPTLLIPPAKILLKSQLRCHPTQVVLLGSLLPVPFNPLWHLTGSLPIGTTHAPGPSLCPLLQAGLLLHPSLSPQPAQEVCTMSVQMSLFYFPQSRACVENTCRTCRALSLSYENDVLHQGVKCSFSLYFHHLTH